MKPWRSASSMRCPCADDFLYLRKLSGGVARTAHWAVFTYSPPSQKAIDLAYGERADANLGSHIHCAQLTAASIRPRSPPGTSVTRQQAAGEVTWLRSHEAPSPLAQTHVPCELKNVLIHDYTPVGRTGFKEAGTRARRSTSFSMIATRRARSVANLTRPRLRIVSSLVPVCAIRFHGPTVIAKPSCSR